MLTLSVIEIPAAILNHVVEYSPSLQMILIYIYVFYIFYDRINMYVESLNI